MDVPLCVLSDTGPPSPSLCSPVTMGTTQGLCVIPSNRLPSALLVFSPGFHLVFLSLKFMVSTLLLHSKNAFDKRIIILFESRIVLMLKWVFVCGQEGKETTVKK